MTNQPSDTTNQTGGTYSLSLGSLARTQTRQLNPWLRFICALAALLAPIAILTGCVTEGKQPRNVAAQPAETIPTTLQMWVRTPLPDTDGNGFPDTLPVTVYLFVEGYPLSLDVPGTFRFELLSAEGKLARAWTFDEAQCKAAIRRAGPGPAYVFALSVLGDGSDRVRRQSVDLTATFTPRLSALGFQPEPVRARTTTIQLGQ